MSAHSGHTGSGAIFAALGANLGIAVLKFIAYLLTRSSRWQTRVTSYFCW